jgi:hypothetical protein
LDRLHDALSPVKASAQPLRTLRSRLGPRPPMTPSMLVYGLTYGNHSARVELVDR